MRHISIWLAGLAAAVVIGCGPGKELPEELPKPKDQSTRHVEPGLKIPKVSDPEAKAVVDRAINLCTQNDPSRLAKAKISKSIATGYMKLPESVPTDRVIVARWPDELKVTYKHKDGVAGEKTLLLRGGLTGFFVNNEPASNVNPKVMEDIIRTDGLARHWLPLLFPLTEPNAVVFDLRKGVGMPPMDVVRFTMLDRPVYQLAFDPTTGYLTGIEYTHIEGSTPYFKSWTFSGHSTFDGLILPTRMEYVQTHDRARTKEVVEDWTVNTWEFPKKLDDAVFDPPK